MPILKINISNELYLSLKKHNLLDQSTGLAIEGLLQGIINKINTNQYRRTYD